MAYDYQCECNQCGAKMTSREFDHHACPAVKGVSPKDFDTFEAYAKAADKAAAEWRKKGGK